MLLWGFAAWQVYFLPQWKPIFMRYGHELPGLPKMLILNVEPWMPIAIGVSLTLVAMFAPWRALRFALIAIALFAAFIAHSANVFMPLKMLRDINAAPEERAKLGIAAPAE